MVRLTQKSLNLRGHFLGHLRVHSRVHFREHFRERFCESQGVLQGVAFTGVQVLREKRLSLLHEERVREPQKLSKS